MRWRRCRWRKWRGCRWWWRRTGAQARASAIRGAARLAGARALGAAQAIAAGTAQVRAALRAEGVGGRRIAVIPPAPDLPASRLRLPRSPGAGPAGLEGAPLLAYAGGLAAEDGLELLLAALASCGGAFRRCGCWWPAAANAKPLDRTARPSRPLRGHVVFTGALSYRRAADLLPRADIAVFPALRRRLRSNPRATC
jgi:glycogen(starch) synthase